MKRLTGLAVLGLLLLVVASPSHATPYTFTATLNGNNENPPVPTSGIGSATVILDPSAHLLFVNVTFSGLTGPTTAAHIHCCTDPPSNIGVATMTPYFTNFPIGVTSGTYNRVFDTQLSPTFNSSFISSNGGTPASAEVALLAGLQTGRAYFNIHTTFRPGGEIRGFLHPVPEPGTLGLLLLGLGGCAVNRARRAFS